MFQKQKNKQKTLRRKVLPLITACVLTYSLFPKYVSSSDFNYSPYSSPDYATLKEIVSRNNYPLNFEFNYIIPKNKDRNGDCLEGCFLLRRENNQTSLEINLFHPIEDKSFSFSEIRQDSLVFYSEKGFDNFKNEKMYDREEVFLAEKRPLTLVSLIENFIQGTVKEKETFVFQGKGEHLKEYKLYAEPLLQDNSNLLLDVKISKNSPRIPRLRIFCKRLEDIVNNINFRKFY